MCSSDLGEEDVAAMATRAASRHELIWRAQEDEEPLPAHALVSNQLKNLGTAGTHVGRCRVCKKAAACGHCHTCSDMKAGRGGIFYLCIPGAHGRHCYVRHLHAALDSEKK